MHVYSKSWKCTFIPLFPCISAALSLSKKITQAWCNSYALIHAYPNLRIALLYRNFPAFLQHFATTRILLKSGAILIHACVFITYSQDCNSQAALLTQF